MKKIFGLAGVIMIIGAILAGCKGSEPSSAEVLYTDEDTAVIKAEESGGSLGDAMEELKEEGKLDYMGSESEYGLFIESVNGRSADAGKNEFWAIYTSLGELDGVSYSDEEIGTYNYEGTVCAGALYGVSGLPMEEGEYYVLAIENYK